MKQSILSLIILLTIIGCQTEPERSNSIFGKWNWEKKIDSTSNPYIFKLEISEKKIAYYLNLFSERELTGEVACKFWNDSIFQVVSRDSTDSLIFQNEYQIFHIDPYSEVPNPQKYEWKLTLSGSELSKDCQSIKSCSGEFPVVIKTDVRTSIFR